jgi:hypothetical protein
MTDQINYQKANSIDCFRNKNKESALRKLRLQLKKDKYTRLEKWCNFLLLEELQDLNSENPVKAADAKLFYE